MNKSLFNGGHVGQTILSVGRGLVLFLRVVGIMQEAVSEPELGGVDGGCLSSHHSKYPALRIRDRPAARLHTKFRQLCVDAVPFA